MRGPHLAIALLVAGPAVAAPVTVASKKFTESVILGEILKDVAQSVGVPAEHRRELGGTRVVWDALVRGDVDLYVEYTGTLRREIYAPDALPDAADDVDDAALRRRLHQDGVQMLPPLGFNNTYALGMTTARAGALGVTRIGDLVALPALRLGLSHELLDRQDGWPSLRTRYGLPQEDVRGLDHELALRALSDGQIDVTDLYTTDAAIEVHHLLVLQDDRHHFPAYDAVVLVREQTARQHPELAAALARLGGTITADQMVAMNAAVDVARQPEQVVAASFVRARLGVAAPDQVDARPARLLKRTGEHLVLVGLSLLLALLVGLPLGVLSARSRGAGTVVLGAASVLQTVPSLALLVVLIPLLGIGARPAVAALFLYGLLPIVRGVVVGITTIPGPLRDAAAALGLPPRARLWAIELPLALPSIMAGVKTAAVLDVGTATLGALIGAGGYGQPILTGIRLDDTGLILEGALPAAALALVVNGLFALLERRLARRRGGRTTT